MLMIRRWKTSSCKFVKVFVVYFSHIGEEYLIGRVSKWNNAIVAEIIAQKIGTDLFEIKPVKNYPESYEECKTVASREKATKARPQLANAVKQGFKIREATAYNNPSQAETKIFECWTG